MNDGNEKKRKTGMRERKLERVKEGMSEKKKKDGVKGER